MIDQHGALTLNNPQTGTLLFGVFPFEDDSRFTSTSSHPYFSLLLVAKGHGQLTADISEYGFETGSLICFSLYQPFSIRSDGALEGLLIHFHPEFFCLHKHRHEVSCNGVLFNNIYESPVLPLEEAEMKSLWEIALSLQSGIRSAGLAQLELLLSYLRIFLINASRIKIRQRGIDTFGSGAAPAITHQLKTAIEEHFTTLHSPGQYADLLFISVKALNRISKVHFNKTLSGLIADRILTEARRQLYLTDKPVKGIAYELGFTDEFYFSRFFKSNVGVSPQQFRDTVGFDKGR